MSSLPLLRSYKMIGFNNSTVSVADQCDIVAINYDTAQYSVRLPLGIFLLSLSLSSVVFYLYVINTILKHKLYKSHLFFLWFVSIGFSDLINLVNYSFSSVLLCFKSYPVSKLVAVRFGHIYHLHITFAFCIFPLWLAFECCPLYSQSRP